MSNLLTKNTTFWILAFPDIRKPIGGIKQLHRLCEALNKLGFSAYLVQGSSEFKPSWFSSSVSCVSKSDWVKISNLDASSNIIILPETFITGLRDYPDLLKVGIPKIVFNQNGSYSFGLPDHLFNPTDVLSFYKHPDIKQVWCVSDYDCGFVKSCLNTPTSKIFKITNSIDIDSFDGKLFIKKKQFAFMPRKNSRDSSIVVCLLKKLFPSFNFVPIENASHDEVIACMEESLGFLSFGHPEGFGLPIAEAMASACFVIGYSGFGGRELFELESAKPCSCEVDYGDFPCFIESMDYFSGLLNSNLDKLKDQLIVNAKHVISHYSVDRMQESVSLALKSL